MALQNCQQHQHYAPYQDEAQPSSLQIQTNIGSLSPASDFSPIYRKRKRPANVPSQEHLERMLDLSGFIKQLNELIDRPIRIPAIHAKTRNKSWNSVKQIPGTAKRDLLSVEDIWENKTEQLAEKNQLYNSSAKSIGDRKWLLDILLEESDADSGGEEIITDEDLHQLLKIHQKRRKFQKDYHNNLNNRDSQYIFYGAGLISVHDFYPEFSLKPTIESLIAPPQTQTNTR